MYFHKRTISVMVFHNNYATLQNRLSVVLRVGGMSLSIVVYPPHPVTELNRCTVSQ